MTFDLPRHHPPQEQPFQHDCPSRVRVLGLESGPQPHPFSSPSDTGPRTDLEAPEGAVPRVVLGCRLGRRAVGIPIWELTPWGSCPLALPGECGGGRARSVRAWARVCSHGSWPASHRTCAQSWVGFSLGRVCSTRLQTPLSHPSSRSPGSRALGPGWHCSGAKGWSGCRWPVLHTRS